MENRRDLLFLTKNVSYHIGFIFDTKLYSKLQEKKNLGSVNFESNTEHDGDIEDISDGERTSSDHGMMFYPATATPGTPT